MNLEDLKEKAVALGVRFSRTTTAEELKARIDEAIEKEEKARLKAQGAKDPKRLIRCIVSPLDPVKKNYQGEIFTVSNGVVGTIKRFIPFNNEAGWHIEAFLLDMIKSKRYQHFITKKDSKGNTMTEARLSPAYSVTILDELGKEGLEKLAREQAARGSIGDE